MNLLQNMPMSKKSFSRIKEKSAHMTVNQSLFENVSLNGLCNVFAYTVAAEQDLDIHMVVHQNPDWDNEQTPAELKQALASSDVQIIHAIVIDKNGYCFDANGYIYIDAETILNINDPFYASDLIRIIASQTSHGDLEDEDPFDIIPFSSDELKFETESNKSTYDMNQLSDVLEPQLHLEYLQWAKEMATQL